MKGLIVWALFLAASIPWLGARTVPESKYVWKTGKWESCYAANGCGEGIRERKVWCSDRTTSSIAVEFCCKKSEEPERTKPCFAACRHHRDHLEWRMGEWGPCSTSDNEVGGTETGIMKRNVTCILTSHDRNMQKLMVIDDDNCLIVGKRPDSVRICVMPTRQECVLTEWSEWTPCCDSTRHRTRSVVVAPHYGAQPCPQLSEWKSCDIEDSECDKSSGGTRLRVEKWGECVVNGGTLWDGDSRGQADNYYKHWPQVGTQRRTVTCLNSAGVSLDPKECFNERSEIGFPMRERACIISQDCAVSKWSDWTVIQEGCVDPNGVEWAEITERKREVLRLHEGQGQGCPHLTETKSTTANLPLCSLKYHWVTSHWSSCTMPGVNGKVVCGGGLQRRNVTCVKADGGQPLAPKYCRNLQHPLTVQRCEVACPRDCEVSQWGSWGPCKPHPDICTTSTNQEQPRFFPNRGERKRTRTVLVAPSDLGLGCPSLEEVQPCDIPRCYIWQTSPWSSCYLNSHQSKCGSGRRKRNVKCITHAGEPVPDSFCSEPMPEAEEPCLLPCPYDCVVSAWSSWTSCSQPCSTSNNMGTKSRNRTIIAPPGKAGHPCPNPDEFMQIKGCNTHGCHGYSWMTLPWQECNATCDSEGYQVREIWCAENQERVSDDRCSTLKKPTDTRTCTIECPTECQVTPWSDWSECDSHICYPNGSRGILSRQSRYRVVLRGENCGPLTETRNCEIRSSPCPKYSWATGNWSDCQLAEGVICGHGLRTRDLWCTMSDTDKRVELRYCLAGEEPIPISVERCHADCHTPCQLTEWSQWTACKQPCSGEKTRKRELIGLSSQHKACKEMKLMETMDCPCTVYYNLPLSDWSSCLTNESTPCGTGTRYRAMGCFNEKNHQLVDPSLCGGSNGLKEEPCFISCPIDCILGEWTSWGDCSSQCGPGMQNRTRKILRKESHGGRPCGNEVETKVCNTQCDIYEWQAGGWSECRLLPSDRPKDCGAGDQYRQVRCVDKRSLIEVEEEMCDWATQPLNMKPCHIACPGDCVLSPWSEWSLCPKDCSGNTQQQRTRSLLRAAANSGAECPRSIETQACQLNMTCFTYKWAVTNYTSCLPLGGSPCGEGLVTRTIYCQRSDGRPVADSWCTGLVKPVSADKWCYIECPIDCELSEWSEWNSTKCHCNQSGMSRHAIIKTNPSSTGRPCPNLIQWKPCPATPCYSWQASPWTPCQLHGATCGHGVKTRNITCIRGKDNVTVENWHCSGTRKPPTWEQCHSPCDSDCQLSNWSEWSHCHADCTKETSGYQTRSRAVIRPAQSAGAEPCPEALWETRPCDLGPCYTFDWTVDSTGQVICQRSDGLHVVGGCNGKKKPGTSACQWQDGHCLCEDGAIVLQQTACPSETNEVQARVYYPRDDHLSVWMFAMIGIGCVFIIFVAASIYLLCHSGREVGMGYQSTK
ncbi:thrombospondin type-1 domain-containing protein 7A-like isoform X2 [Cimex lectularius]|uniref:Spondin-like TSP1 domain-containing protein n=1 Tax=Cimex lectularius TaxID=79782 RepID=A0A8I6SG00_CIMLE|nr:thrombospondin type-1 domain-containing protein 7A-like isoform X2 [Cimex lectularius]